MGSDDWRAVVEDMTLADGDEVWPIPVDAGDRPRLRRGRRHRARGQQRQGARADDRQRGLRARRRARGRAGLPHDRQRAPRRRRDPRGGQPLRRRQDRGRRRARSRGGVHAPLPHPRRVAQGGVREAGLEADRRLPDAQPDPPRARVPDQGGARGLRRALPAPADRRDEEGRHPRRRADALLRDPDGEVLPERPRRARRQPGRDALRRPARGDLPRRSSAATTARRTSSSAATTPASGDYYGTYDAQKIFDEIDSTSSASSR